MEQIASFCVDHDRLDKGFYISRIDRDVVTYDIRMVKPNCPPYLENAALHTFEHLFATYVRNSPLSDSVVYVGPMGCRTGFYFLVRDDMSHQQALDLFRETLDYVCGFEGPIPGAQYSRECGNYLDHDLNGAKAIGEDMKKVLAHWTVEQMSYDNH